MSTQRGADHFHEATHRLWQEFKIAADYTTGMSEPTRATAGPPAGFVQNELGLGLESPDRCGPGCRCNALQSLSASTPTAKLERKRRRSGRQWQDMLTAASAHARAA